ncbi:hypothetical protein [Streptomyces sp. YGL11-2]|uniref:hypothetical protein n=1 Tax=Streptomyces sp. YGL11-2 TaxID=3414028 RepID=UPI003CF8182C
MALHKPGQAAFQVLDLPGQLLDAPGQQAQRDPGCLQHRVAAAPVFVVVGEPRAGADQGRVVQHGHFLPQDRVGGNTSP